MTKKKKFVGVEVEKEIYNAFAEKCKSQKSTKSEILRQLIKNFIEGNNQETIELLNSYNKLSNNFISLKKEFVDLKNTEITSLIDRIIKVEQSIGGIKTSMKPGNITTKESGKWQHYRVFSTKHTLTTLRGEEQVWIVRKQKKTNEMKFPRAEGLADDEMYKVVKDLVKHSDSLREYCSHRLDRNKLALIHYDTIIPMLFPHLDKRDSNIMFGKYGLHIAWDMYKVITRDIDEEGLEIIHDLYGENDTVVDLNGNETEIERTREENARVKLLEQSM